MNKQLSYNFYDFLFVCHLKYTPHANMSYQLPLLGILFEMRLLNLRINFIVDFCPHLRSFFVVVFLTTFRPNFTSGRLQVINHSLG